LSTVLLGLIALPSYGTIIQTGSAISSVGTQVNFRAELTIAGDTLTITLFNQSPQSSTAPNDTLSSYYFDIIKNGSRPALSYFSASGDVYLANKNSPDALQTANANLKAVNPGDRTWQFKSFNAVSTPYAGFGIGTVGNNNLSPNNFNGNIVDGLDYSIYTGDIAVQNLDGKLLVKNQATFVFKGLTGFTEQDISPSYTFGMGTAPDSLIFVPEPATLAILCFGGLLFCSRK
jgi:hypothetical protein